MICPKTTKVISPVLEQDELYLVDFSEIFVSPVLENLQGSMFHAIPSLLLCLIMCFDKDH